MRAQVTPVVPNTLLNLASPIVGLPLWPYALGAGLLSWQVQRRLQAVADQVLLWWRRHPAGLPSQQLHCLKRRGAPWQHDSVERCAGCESRVDR